MYCKDNVIYLNRVDSAWVNGKVLVLDDRREEEAQIEGRVAQVSSNVQDEEVKVEANHTATSEVENHLHRERGNKLLPLQHTTYPISDSTDISVKWFVMEVTRMHLLPTNIGEVCIQQFTTFILLHIHMHMPYNTIIIMVAAQP